MSLVDHCLCIQEVRAAGYQRNNNGVVIRRCNCQLFTGGSAVRRCFVLIQRALLVCSDGKKSRFARIINGMECKEKRLSGVNGISAMTSGDSQ